MRLTSLHLQRCARVSARVSHIATVSEKPWQNVRDPGCSRGQVEAECTCVQLVATGTAGEKRGLRGPEMEHRGI